MLYFYLFPLIELNAIRNLLKEVLRLITYVAGKEPISNKYATS